ncbi:MAG: sodium:solute symporter family protein [Oscillospiraceae bacterium]
MANISVWITIAIYIVIMVVIGVVSGKQSKSISDFTVGGRSAGAWISAMSYGAAYFSAVMFVGYAGVTGLKFGLWGILAGIGNAIFGSWLAWKVLARKTRDVSSRLNINTMPQFFEVRYDSKAIKTFSSIVIFIFLIPYSASVYKGLASVAEVLLGINDTICLIIIAALSMLLLLLGGYLVQARADFVQGIVMMVGIVMLIVVVVRSNAVGGFEGLVEYAKSDVGLPKLDGMQWVSLLATVLMTSFGTWGLPQMVQKFFGIKDDEQAKRGIVISTLFGFIVAGGGYFVGSLCHKFFTVGVDMPAQDYIVPMMLKAAQIPNILLGVVIVLLIAASVSTLCSITLTACSIFTIDLVKERRKRKLTENESSILIKVLCVIFVLVSYIVANTDTPILDMMSYSWGIISGSFLAPYFLALFIKWLNRAGAWSGMLGGFLIAIIPAVCKVVNIVGYTSNNIINNLSANGPLFACIAMIMSIILCLAVSAITNRKKGKNTNEFFYTGVVKSE